MAFGVALGLDLGIRVTRVLGRLPSVCYRPFMGRSRLSAE
jgi:hypothetical protein